MKCPQKGFIALISSIIISFVLLFTALSLGQTGMIARLSLLSFEEKAMSAAYAEGCSDAAHVALLNNPLYNTATRTISLNNDSCSFWVLQKTADESEVLSHARVRNAETNLQYIINHNGVVLSKEETVNP